MTWLLPQLPPTFDAALRDVAAKRAEARIVAAERLGRPDPGREREALDALERLAGDAVPGVRAAAVHALDAFEGAARVFVAKLDDADARVRELATIGLAGGGDGAREALRGALSSPHPEVRFQAVLSLCELAPDDVDAAVAPLIEDGDPEVRANAARALGAGDGARGLAALRRALDDAAPRVRREAALALAQRGVRPPSEGLADALLDEDLVAEALDALGDPAHAGAADRVATLTGGLLRPLLLRAAAARALVRMGDERGVPALRRALDAWRGDARAYVVETAGELGLAELGPDLARRAGHPGIDPDLLAGALARLAPRSEAAREALERLADGPGQTGDAARRALGRPPLA